MVKITGVSEHGKDRNMVKITGVSEPKSTGREDTDRKAMELIKDKLDIDIKEEDISRCFRGKRRPKNDGTGVLERPIIVEFTRNKVCRKVIQARKKLKGTGIGVNEVLAFGRRQLLTQAYRMVNDIQEVKACWSWEGTVYILIKERNESAEKRVAINSYRDIEYWASKFGFVARNK